MSEHLKENPLYLFEGYNEGLEDYVVGSYVYQPVYDKVTKRFYHHHIVRDDGFRMPVKGDTVRPFVKKLSVYSERQHVIEQVKKKMKAMGISGVTLSDMTGLHRNNIYNFLKGKDVGVVIMDEIFYALDLQIHVPGQGPFEKYDDLINYINSKRVSLGWSIKHVSEQIGVSASSVNWFFSKLNAKTSTLFSVMLIMGIDFTVC